MTIERERKPARRGNSDLAERCSAVRRDVIAFFDWAGYNNARKRSEWESWATQRIHDGWPLEQVHDHLKARWMEHRRASGLPMRIEAPTHAEVQTLIDALSQAFGRSFA